MTEDDTTPAFAMLPRAVLWNPPCSRDGADFRLLPFDLAVLAGLLSLAQQDRIRQNYALAFQGGAKAIAIERARREEYQQRWNVTNAARKRGEPAVAPTLVHNFDGLIEDENGNWRELEPGEQTHKPISRKRAFRKAGKLGFIRARIALKKPRHVTLIISGYSLLKRAGLAINARSRIELRAALRRLCQPIHSGDMQWNAPLLDCKCFTSGRVRVTVAKQWLPTKVFGLVPLPLPIRSPVAMNLWLHLRTINTNRHGAKSVGGKTLYARLGIKGRQPRRTLSRALDVVNDHLVKLDTDALHWDCEIDVPLSYKVVDDDGKLSLQHRARRFAEYQADDDADEEQEKKISVQKSLLPSLTAAERVRGKPSPPPWLADLLQLYPYSEHRSPVVCAAYAELAKAQTKLQAIDAIADLRKLGCSELHPRVLQDST